MPDDVRSQLGVLLEHNGLYLNMSASDNLHYFGSLSGDSMGANELGRRVEDALRFVGFSEDANLSVSKLSKGNMRKVALARSIMNQPKVLVLDEPTDGLDPLSQRETRNALLRYVKDNEVALIVTSHNMSEVAYMADKILVISGGVGIAYGSPSELIENQGVVVEINLLGDSVKANDIVDVLKKHGDCRRYEQLTPMKIQIYAKVNEVSKILEQCNMNVDCNEIEISERKCSLEEAYCLLVG